RFLRTGNAIGSILATNDNPFDPPSGTWVPVPTDTQLFSIPAGLPSIDLHVIPANDSSGNGDETLVLTLLLRTNDIRVTTILSNIFTTNGSTITSNTIFADVTNNFRIPGWELRP